MTETAKAAAGGDHLVEKGEVKTQFHCHHCSKSFLAIIDFDINGNHVVECAWCGHEHLRVIQDGKVTEERWGSRQQRKDEVIRVTRVWRHDSLAMKSTCTTDFLREKWLNRYAG